MITKCYFCMRPFKPGDFSTFFCYRSDNVEKIVHDKRLQLLAHDDCLEFFTQGIEAQIVQFGHKIWSEDDE